MLLIKKYSKAFCIVSRMSYVGKLQQKFKEALKRGKNLETIQKKKAIGMRRFGISVSITPYSESIFWAAFCSILEHGKCFTLQNAGISELEF